MLHCADDGVICEMMCDLVQYMYNNVVLRKEWYIVLIDGQTGGISKNDISKCPFCILDINSFAVTKHRHTYVNTRHTINRPSKQS